MTRVFYSVAQQFDRSGSSRPLTRVRDALQREFSDKLEVLSGDSFPVEFADTSRLGDGLGPCYDDRAASEFRKKGHRKISYVTDPPPSRHDSSETFVGGGGASLQQMRLFDKTVTCWFSSHFDWANKVLGEEYRACGIKSEPIHPYVRWRAGQEQALSTLMIVPSEACKSTYPKELQDKIRVVNFGVDSTLFTPPKTPRSRDGPLRVLFPATNPARKGIRQVLNAWATLPHNDFELTITGGIQGGNLGLPPSSPPVKALGWVSEEKMLSLYQESDVMLLPSHEEGYALAATEAMACGLPIIVTPNVGVTFPINEKFPLDSGGDIGWLVGRGSVHQLRDALIEAQKDRDELMRKSEKARKFAEAMPWSKFGEGVVNVVKKAIES